MFRWFKKLLISFFILVVAIQPVFVPVAYAVESWTGDSWEGDPWEGNPWDGSNLEWQGDPWDGSDLQWNGESWEGDPWEGNGTEGEPWEGDSSGTSGDSWTGEDWSSLPWYLQGWYLNGSNGADPWSGDSFSGNGTNGNSFSTEGFNGNSTDGKPWVKQGMAGIGSPWMLQNSSTKYKVDKPTLEDATPPLPYEYEVSKYITKDVVMGQADLIGDLLTHQNMNDMGYDSKMSYGLKYRGNILMNGLKLGVGDNALTDAYDTYSHVYQGIEGIQDYRYIKQAYSNTKGIDDLAQASQKISNTSPPPSTVGALSKFNVAAAAVGAGFSAVDTGMKAANAVDILNSNADGNVKTAAVADTTASLGDTLMNAGVVTSAIPGAQAIGAGMVAVGAGVWLVSKGTGFVARHWKGNVKDTAKAMWNTTKKSAKKAWDTVKGWFS
ncbi:hypothetical protein [Tenuibacillus multivorans]|uniref:Uncharacterized protein n=1 Tax=Tenuibacillus multivorans TaxID=237069 RepID=A0A1G9WHN6_9BACI|nr:hypothetical protein [Tenuibacillus multivorans]GEL76470.1 hypothetical protein TMU01_07050 [Tenuibacillus multivorans]SDM84048.1 hypothetical protein SAMN05216498_0757 [Tenuibacillus multivorans]